MSQRQILSTATRLSLYALLVSAPLLAQPEEGADQDFVSFGRIPCVSVETPPFLHCADGGCDGATAINQGNAVEMTSRRTYFLDYPCDLKPGEPVTLVLSLHGGGSYGNWQRHYFPLLDSVQQYRLVVATPNSPTQVWTEADDAYLQAIVTSVTETLGEEAIESFWLVGHSQGGQTSNRLLMTDFFRERLDGWVSLSGGRLGSKREDVRATIPSVPGIPRPTSGRPMRLTADASILPGHPFSHIYVSGEHELTERGLPADSPWAQKLGCGAQSRQPDIIDTRGGYVYDTRVQPNRNPIWGMDPGPGRAEVYLYPGCKDGRVVADIVRMGKGHTEGFEPRVTEAIVRMMKEASR